jgi:hypothetical protein
MSQASDSESEDLTDRVLVELAEELFAALDREESHTAKAE